MNKPAPIASRPHRRGFTFVEVLAAMLFMAIVIPVVMQGLSVANRLAAMADRKKFAAELADRLLTEKVADGEWKLGGQEGDVVADSNSYHWTLSTTNWSEESMLVVSMAVRFKVQSQDSEVSLNTLVDGTAQ